jgi:hypothetical protein
MTRMIALVAILVLGMAVNPMTLEADSLSIGVNIGTPTPPPPPPVVVVPTVVTAPPQLVAVPGSPVFYAPGISLNLFVYGGRYYTFHEGTWFAAATYGVPWKAIAVERVPQPVLAVPVTYYQLPPGRAKKVSETRGHGNGCPPGLAKQGRC